jgi:heat shock protein 4
MNETTAVALTYGLLRPLPKDESIKVLFLDVGASKTSCACVEFKAGQLEVLATKTITNCGGWYFDQVLAVAMAADIQKRYKLDIMSNAKARMKLFKEAERVKKNLSANSVVNWGVEYIMDGTDVSGKMSRADFEALITPAVDKIFPAVTDVLEKCALKAEELHSIEVVGGASRIPIVQARLRELLGRDLSKTCDSDEAVARGCALQCAMLSHLVQVLPFALKDRTEFDISVSYVDGAQSSGMDVQMEDAGVAFKAGELIPREAIIEIPSSYSSFEVVAYYTDPSQLPPNTPTNLGRFVVSDVPAQKEGDDRTYKTKVTFRLDGSDMLSVDSVSYLEEIVEAPNSSAAADTVPAENGDKKDAKKEESTDAQEPVAKKTKFSRTELACTSDFPTVTPKQQQEYFDREIKMINNDRVVRETSDMRNELESYVLEMRTKLRSESDLQPYCTEEEAASLIARMDKEEAWLDDEGYDVQKSEYKTHLGDLFALCGPALARARQHQKRDPAIKSLKQVINFYSRWAQDEAANDEKFAHIAQDELNKVLACCQEADQWLLSQQLLQDKLVLHQDPVLTVEALDTRRKSVDKFSNGIRNTPKPKPPKPAPAEEKKPADKAAPAADNSSAEAEVPPAATEEAAPAADNSNAEAPAADAADAAPADNSNTKMDVDE